MPLIRPAIPNLTSTSAQQNSAPPQQLQFAPSHSLPKSQTQLPCSTTTTNLPSPRRMLLSRLRAAAHTIRTMYTIADVKRLSAKTLSEKILAERDAPVKTYAVVDVRDDDYIGGHISGSQNIPIGQLDAMLATLTRTHKDKSAIVFHCALSQQRGPSAALQYLRERESLLKTLGDTESIAAQGGQTVFILDRGFTGWQEVYGEDERLTEGFRKEVWRQ